MADLSALVLCRLFGTDEKNTIGNTYCYIKSYADQLGLKSHAACLKLMKETEQALNLILAP